MAWNPKADRLRRLARRHKLRLAHSPRPGPNGEDQWAVLNWNGAIVFGDGGPKPWCYSASLDEVEDYLNSLTDA